MKKTKVLFFVDRLLVGGIQSLLYNWVERLDLSKISVDFLVLDDGNTYELEDKIHKIGCRVIKLKNIWVKSPIDFIKEAKALDTFFKENHDYDVVHLHSSSKNYMVLKYAKKYNIKTRISHSHSVGFQTTNPIKKIIGNIFKKRLIHYSTDFFACSKDAGEWLFGKKIIEQNNFHILHNAIDLEKFKYNSKKREKIRMDYSLSEKTVVMGHIGRFMQQKNHSFLIDIFNEFHKINKNSKLMLVGTGELESEIKNKAKELKLIDDIIFVGFKENANDYIQAFDLFVFPSLFEGLGIVLIEAQASGLPCFASKYVIPEEAKILKSFKSISLDVNPKEWANIINNSSLERCFNVKEAIIKSGYDINEVICYLQKFYIDKARGNL